MKQLPTTFTGGGFHFRQLDRIGNVALFKKYKTPDSAMSLEVVRIRHHNGFTAFGKQHPPAEFYPSSERFGVDGFTFCDLKRARAKFRELAEAQDRPALHPTIAAEAFSPSARVKVASPKQSTALYAQTTEPEAA